MSELTEEKRMPFLAHLEELRRRLIVSVIAVLIGTSVAWVLTDPALRLLLQPLRSPSYISHLVHVVTRAFVQHLPNFAQRLGVQQSHEAFTPHKLVYAAPLEPFFIQVKLSVIMGIMLVLPILFHQLWLFVAPGLLRHERRVVIPFVIGSAVAFLTGAVFFLFILWPAVVNFSLSYANEYLDPLLNLSAYVNFALRLILIFGLIFELPVLSFVLARAGVIRAEFLARFRRFAILGSAIVGAFHSDLLTMGLIAVPLYLMYELSIWVARIFGRRHQPAAAAAPAKV